MRRLGWWLLVLVLAGGAYALSRHLVPGAEPGSVGGPLTQQLKRGRGDVRFEVALLRAGTNAVPDLIAATQWTPTRSDDIWRQIYNWIPDRVQAHAGFLLRQPPDQVHLQALYGLAALGPDAAAALPAVLSHVGEGGELTEAALTAALAIAPHSPETQAACVSSLLIADSRIGEGAARAVAGSDVVVTNALAPLLAAIDRPGGLPSLAQIKAVGNLGPLASHAVPGLAALLTDTNRAPAALQTLARIGPIAVLAQNELRRVLKSHHPASVAGALEVLAAIGPEAASALEEARPLQESDDPLIRILSAVAVARLRGRPAEAVPGLVREISIHAPDGSGTPYTPSHPAFRDLTLSPAETAVWWLGLLGRDARGAVTYLLPLLDDENRWMRVLAAWTLWRITRDPGFAVPTLRTSLVNSVDPRARTLAAAAVAELGRMGLVLEPELEIAARSDLRTRRVARAALRQLAAER